MEFYKNEFNYYNNKKKSYIYLIYKISDSWWYKQTEDDINLEYHVEY